MNLQQAIQHLRDTIDAFNQKRRGALTRKDIDAIQILLLEIHRKDRL